MSTLLLLDVSNLSYRNWHAMRFSPGFNTVIGGLLRDLISLYQIFDEDCQFVFCFDGLRDKEARQKFYPAYKANRVFDDAKAAVSRQTEILYKEILPAVGYRNIFRLDEYEADDLIGWFVRKRKDEEMVIVSNDSDLYQLLGQGVKLWNPKVKLLVDEEWLMSVHSLRPDQWATYKAIVGDRTDNIIGVEKVGDVTAKAYLTGNEVKRHKDAAGRIDAAKETVERNVCLVTVPFYAVDEPALVLIKDKPFNRDQWDKMAAKFNCKHFIGKYPQ